MKSIIYILLLTFIISGCATAGKKMDYSRIFDDELSDLKDTVGRGNLPQAIRELSMLLEMDPKNKDARFLRAVAYQKRGQYKKAIEDYKILIKNYPDTSRAHYNLGMIYAFKEINKGAALESFDSFLTLDPTHAKAFDVAKLMCAIKNSMREARLSETDGVERFFANWSLDRAKRESDTDTKEKMIRGSAELDSTNPAHFIELARLSKANGRTKEAIKYYEKASVADPTNAEVHDELSRLLKQENRPAEAKIHSMKAKLFRLSSGA